MHEIFFGKQGPSRYITISPVERSLFAKSPLPVLSVSTTVKGNSSGLTILGGRTAKCSGVKDDITGRYYRLFLELSRHILSVFLMPVVDAIRTFWINEGQPFFIPVLG